ncbi:tripartite tricarboxylate transporter TctB family protein [Oceanimonas pelagia]|uniref:Tripartite tricarboxylate transporter TctB family protein n=1 Tax=Oceanimonas pelagia TaxID=3028314 RepID=A0AA50KLC6_9GAMM|nr:tripartite tricarboxylate transporter TctB family protein [Oceanimonas pelagia]WMC10261.1 tripartite tricarboxylate transporter TctB family protein [Oceanimonas pelagia]
MSKLIHTLGSDRFFALLLITASAILYALIGGLDEPGSPGELAASTYPRILLLCLMLFSLVLILKPNRSDADRIAHFPLKGLSVIAVIAGYIALVDLVGYFVLTPALLLVLPLLAGFRNLRLIMISVCGVTAALYGIFDLVLNIPLPAGFLGD